MLVIEHGAPNPGRLARLWAQVIAVEYKPGRWRYEKNTTGQKLGIRPS